MASAGQVRMGRPPKPPKERLVSVTVSLPPDVLDMLSVKAIRERKTNSGLLREMVYRSFRIGKVRKSEIPPIIAG